MVGLTACPAAENGQTSGAEGSSGDAASTSTGGENSTGSGISFEDFSELCVSQADRAGCEAVEGFEGDAPGEPQFGFCVWETSVPVEVVENGACLFGEARGRCVVDTGSTVGCASPGVECMDLHTFGGVRESDDGAVLVEGRYCTGVDDAAPCSLDADGNGIEPSLPECVCFCDPAYPD